jgi:hypothetical protein
MFVLLLLPVQALMKAEERQRGNIRPFILRVFLPLLSIACGVFEASLAMYVNKLWPITQTTSNGVAFWPITTTLKFSRAPRAAFKSE